MEDTTRKTRDWTIGLAVSIEERRRYAELAKRHGRTMSGLIRWLLDRELAAEERSGG